MVELNDGQQRWEVRITLRLAGALSEGEWDDMLPALKRVEVAIGRFSSVATANVGGVAGARHHGITGSRR